MFDLISRNLKDNNLSSLSWRIFRHLNISYLWVECNQSVTLCVCLSVYLFLALSLVYLPVIIISSQSGDKHIHIASSLSPFWCAVLKLRFLLLPAFKKKIQLRRRGGHWSGTGKQQLTTRVKCDWVWRLLIKANIPFTLSPIIVKKQKIHFVF